MQYNTLPVFSFPTTIICVDDDALFLKSLTHQLNKAFNKTPTLSIKSFKTFNNSKECLNILQNYKIPIDTKRLLQSIDGHEKENELNQAPIHFNFQQLGQLHHNIGPIEEISILIADLDMPEMNGIELCQQLKHFPAQKILLTGHSGLKKPIDAFNDNTIDCYISKGSEALIHEILFHVDRLSKKYFIEKTKLLLEHLETDKQLPLSDPIFIDFFLKFCQDNQITAYYLIDKNGTFLMKDHQNKITYFVVYTQQDRDNFLKLYDNLYEDQYEDQFSDIRYKIQKEAKIPFFGPQMDPLKIDTALWDKHLYSAHILNGREAYYWAIVADEENND